MAKLPPANASDAELVHWALELVGVAREDTMPEDYQKALAGVARLLLHAETRAVGRPPSPAKRELVVAVQTLRAEMDKVDRERWEAFWEATDEVDDEERARREAAIKARQQRREDQRQAALEIKRCKDAGRPISKRLKARRDGPSRTPVTTTQALREYHTRNQLPGDWMDTTKPAYEDALEKLVEEFGLANQLTRKHPNPTRVELPLGGDESLPYVEDDTIPLGDNTAPLAEFLSLLVGEGRTEEKH